MGYQPLPLKYKKKKADVKDEHPMQEQWDKLTENGQINGNDLLEPIEYTIKGNIDIPYDPRLISAYYL